MNATPRRSRVIRADQLSDRHCGRWIKVGDVTAELIGFHTLAGVVRIEARIGKSRAEFALRPDAHVEHWAKGE